RRTHRRVMQARPMVTDPAARGTAARSGAGTAPSSSAPGGDAPVPPARSQHRRRIWRSSLGALGVLGFMATWEIVARTGIIDRRFLPPFTETAARLVVELGKARFWSALSETLVTWALGLGIATIAAIAAGAVIGLV